MGAVVAGCSPDKAGSAPFASTSLPASATAVPSGPPDWNSLRSRLSGRLDLPGESAFESAKRGFDSFFDNQAPSAIVQCVTPEDVRTCVTAAALRLPIAARSGGHSYAGYSVPDQGLVVDVGPMSRVEVRGDQVVVGAGARLEDVYAARCSGPCVAAVVATSAS